MAHTCDQMTMARTILSTPIDLEQDAERARLPEAQAHSGETATRIQRPPLGQAAERLSPSVITIVADASTGRGGSVRRASRSADQTSAARHVEAAISAWTQLLREVERHRAVERPERERDHQDSRPRRARSPAVRSAARSEPILRPAPAGRRSRRAAGATTVHENEVDGNGAADPADSPDRGPGDRTDAVRGGMPVRRWYSSPG